jgi:hypothetical protein
MRGLEETEEGCADKGDEIEEMVRRAVTIRPINNLR